MTGLWLLLACGDSAQEELVSSPAAEQTTAPSKSNAQPMKRPTQPNTPALQKNGPQNGPPGLPGSSASEDLTLSWNTDFAVPAQPNLGSKPDNCPDNDGDGFVDATVCGDWIDVAKADCDDANPDVTPAVERYIPSGRFIMGSESSHAGADEKPVHLVELSGYCVDVDEVSAEDFALWLTQTNTDPKGQDIRSLVQIKEGWTTKEGRANHPAEGVTWQEASDYCTAKGQSLPTEAQWEKSARGGCELGTDPTMCDEADLRAYPWGTEAPSCELANHQLSAGGLPKLCVSNTQLPEELSGGMGPYGHRHLAGNVWEYVADVWHPNVYSETMRINPAGPKSGDVHVLRGGGWNTFSTNMRAANRFHDLIMGSASGFRCARSFSEQIHDDVEPLVFATVKGTISSTKALSGRALYITAFDANDADANGMLIPGRSPIAETRLTPNDQTSQSFALSLPHGSYILSAALDAGTGAQKDDYVSASGSGGFGHAKENPISVATDVDDIHIELQSAPMMMKPNAQQPNGPKGMPGKPPQFQPNRK